MAAALPRDEAIAYIAGKDKRPLIILRECKLCNGTDDALLSRSYDNTRTLIMTRWFHCVKLPMEVLSDDHPFHALFPEVEATPHLFISRWDGSDAIPLMGDRDNKELWTNMLRMVDSEYLKDSEKAVKKLSNLMDEYDMMDREIRELESAAENQLEAGGPESKKFKKAQAALDKARQEMADLKAEEVKLSDLKLKYDQPGYKPEKKEPGASERVNS